MGAVSTTAAPPAAAAVLRTTASRCRRQFHPLRLPSAAAPCTLRLPGAHDRPARPRELRHSRPPPPSSPAQEGRTPELPRRGRALNIKERLGLVVCNLRLIFADGAPSGGRGGCVRRTLMPCRRQGRRPWAKGHPVAGQVMRGIGLAPPGSPVHINRRLHTAERDSRIDGLDGFAAVCGGDSLGHACRDAGGLVTVLRRASPQHLLPVHRSL